MKDITSMTTAELSSLQERIAAEQAERASNTQKLKEWAGRSLGRIEAAREVFAQSATPQVQAPAVATSNGHSKAKGKSKPAVKVAKGKGRQAAKVSRPTYRDPKSNREWRGFGPMPSWLAQVPEGERKNYLLSTSQG